MTSFQQFSALRTQQRNPASYWGRLSHDVVNYYLIKQYTDFWVFSAGWEIVPSIELDSEPPGPIRKTVAVGDIQFVFHASNQVQVVAPYCIWMTSSFRLGEKIYLLCKQDIYIFSTDYQFLTRQDGMYQSIHQTEQGELILTDKVANQERSVEILTVTSRRFIRLLCQPAQGIHRIDKGIIYCFAKKQLILYSLATGELLRRIDLSSYMEMNIYLVRLVK